MRWIAVVAASLLACSPPLEVATARLSLRDLPSCALAGQPPLQVRATGDFPSERREIDRGVPGVLDAFPPDTRWLAIESGEGQARAGSLVALTGQDQDVEALLLPLGRSCPLGDVLVAAPAGAALAALSGGGLLIAGGTQFEGTAATAHAAVLPPGAALARTVEQGMLLRRAGATATAVGARVVVAGGGPDDRGSAHDAFEVYDEASGAFDIAQSANLSGGPRREHGAVRVPDGRVLLVGGVSEVGAEPLASAELIELDAGDSTLLDARLGVARNAPQVLLLDSGTVLVALGRDEEGQPVAEVERFDLDALQFEAAAMLPVHEEAAVAVLEGDRVAYVGCSGSDEEPAECELWWLLPDGVDFAAVQSTLEPDALAREGLRGLVDLRAASLGDGRLLVTGRDRSDSVERRAFVIDPNEPAIERVDASRVPERLVALADGVIAELDPAGASLRRPHVQSELDDPAEALLGPGPLAVALDAAERWRRDGAELEARQDARIDLPRLRFAAVRVELDVRGAAWLLLEPEAAPPVEVAVTADHIGIGVADCTLERADGRAIAIARESDRITLVSGDRSKRCRATELGGRIGVAVRAVAHARIHALRVVRR